MMRNVYAVIVCIECANNLFVTIIKHTIELYLSIFYNTVLYRFPLFDYTVPPDIFSPKFCKKTNAKYKMRSD